MTNALKHAQATRGADVTVRYRPHELDLQIADDGKGPAATNGHGHGLVGIRERVTIYGGEMSAGGTRWRVRAQRALPVDQQQR